MNVLKDFVRMVFGMDDNAPVSKVDVAMVILALIFICTILSVAV
jgi:hypothetical protein